ncbi:MAG: hypothetical protein ABUL44_03295, partial [Flavobacterium sp.]
MLIKIIILNNLRFAVLLLLLICYAQFMQAQVNDSLQVTTHDSVALIRGVLKENLVQQWQQCGTYQKLEKIRLKELLKDSSAVDSLGKLILQQMHQIKETSVKTGKSVATDAVYTSKQIAREHFAKLMQTQDIKGLIDQFTGMIKQPS